MYSAVNRTFHISVRISKGLLYCQLFMTLSHGVGETDWFHPFMKFDRRDSVQHICVYTGRGVLNFLWRSWACSMGVRLWWLTSTYTILRLSLRWPVILWSYGLWHKQVDTNVTERHAPSFLRVEVSRALYRSGYIRRLQWSLYEISNMDDSPQSTATSQCKTTQLLRHVIIKMAAALVWRNLTYLAALRIVT
jgi:hypothetical protein